MRALIVSPHVAGSATLEEIKAPVASAGRLLVELVALGICGTDREILSGRYGIPPAGKERLIIGHESIGRVLDAPRGSGFAVDDLVVGIVRHPDPVPCPNCAVGEWDMCRNGLYTEHGIKGRDGFACERYLLDPAHTVKVDRSLGELGVLLEPASILAKAWEHVERIGERARFRPRRALVMGAGPVGLLGALMGRQRDLEVTVLDRAREGRKPDLVRRLGARYLTTLGDLGEAAQFDVVLECTGAALMVIEAMQRVGPNGIACLTGVSSGGRQIQVDAGALGREIVLENAVIFGSVNANRRHYEGAARSLAAADRNWLAGLITGRFELENWRSAVARDDDTIKNVITRHR